MNDEEKGREEVLNDEEKGKEKVLQDEEKGKEELLNEVVVLRFLRPSPTSLPSP